MISIWSQTPTNPSKLGQTAILYSSCFGLRFDFGVLRGVIIPFLRVLVDDGHGVFTEAERCETLLVFPIEVASFKPRPSDLLQDTRLAIPLGNGNGVQGWVTIVRLEILLKLPELGVFLTLVFGVWVGVRLEVLLNVRLETWLGLRLGAKLEALLLGVAD